VAQLGELARRYEEFEERGATVVAITQEDSGRDMMWDLVDALDGDLPFRLGSDPGRAATTRYDRIATYLLDETGEVLEVFPVHRRMYMPWDAVLSRLDDLAAE
jgi:peroxiredoxin